MEATKKAFSIDFEPQTLNSDQIQQAREAALYLLNTKSSEEAQKIFTETSEKAQENFIEGVNSDEVQETQEKKTDAMGADDTNLVQEAENEKMEAVGSNDSVDFEEEFDYSSSDDDSMVPTLVIDPERDVFSAPF